MFSNVQWLPNSVIYMHSLFEKQSSIKKILINEYLCFSLLPEKV